MSDSLRWLWASYKATKLTGKGCLSPFKRRLTNNAYFSIMWALVWNRFLQVLFIKKKYKFTAVHTHVNTSNHFKGFSWDCCWVLWLVSMCQTLFSHPRLRCEQYTVSTRHLSTRRVWANQEVLSSTFHHKRQRSAQLLGSDHWSNSSVVSFLWDQELVVVVTNAVSGETIER